MTPDAPDLKPYGYAPGNYTKKCLFCDSIMRDVDKSATHCRPCAEEKRARVEIAQPATPEPADITFTRGYESGLVDGWHLGLENNVEKFNQQAARIAADLHEARATQPATHVALTDEQIVDLWVEWAHGPRADIVEFGRMVIRAALAEDKKG